MEYSLLLTYLVGGFISVAVFHVLYFLSKKYGKGFIPAYEARFMLYTSKQKKIDTAISFFGSWLSLIIILVLFGNIVYQGIIHKGAENE